MHCHFIILKNPYIHFVPCHNKLVEKVGCVKKSGSSMAFEGSLRHEMRCVPETSTLGIGLLISSQVLLPATFYFCKDLTLVSDHLSDCCFSTEILLCFRLHTQSSSLPLFFYHVVNFSVDLTFPLPTSLNPMAYLLSCIHSISWLSHDKTLTLKSGLLPRRNGNWLNEIKQLKANRG